MARAMTTTGNPALDEMLRRRSSPAAMQPQPQVDPTQAGWQRNAFGLSLAGRLLDSLTPRDDAPEPVSIQARGLSTDNLSRLYGMLENNRQTDLAWKSQQQQRQDAARREQQAIQARLQDREADRAFREEQAQAHVKASADLKQQEIDARAQLARDRIIEEIRRQESEHQFRAEQNQANAELRRELHASSGSGGGGSSVTGLRWLDTVVDGNPVKIPMGFNKATGQMMQVGEPIATAPKTATPRMIMTQDENGNPMLVQATPTADGAPQVSSGAVVGSAKDDIDKALTQANKMRQLRGQGLDDPFEGWTPEQVQGYMDDVSKQQGTNKKASMLAIPPESPDWWDKGIAGAKDASKASGGTEEFEFDVKTGKTRRKQ